MARISREEVQKREKFAFALFLKHPELSVAKANVEIEKEFNATMRQKRLYELRGGAKAKREGKAWSDPAEVARAKKAAAKGQIAAPRAAAREARATRGGASNVHPAPKLLTRMEADLPFIYKADAAAAQVISDFLESVRAKGLTNLKVELITGKDYLVVDTVQL